MFLLFQNRMIEQMGKYNIFWFRRDMRLQDNAGLYHALKSGHVVKPIFIFDTEILDKLDDRSDARVSFIHTTITELQQELAKIGSSLQVYHGSPTEIWKKLAEDSDLVDVYTNRD